MRVWKYNSLLYKMDYHSIIEGLNFLAQYQCKKTNKKLWYDLWNFISFDIEDLNKKSRLMKFAKFPTSDMKKIYTVGYTTNSNFYQDLNFEWILDNEL